MDRVVELLRDRIIAAHYPPGEALPRRRLAEELNLGTTVVGEALRVMRREGLLCRGRRGEMRVVSHDRSVLLDAFELRYQIDGLAARLAAEHGASPGVPLRKALAEQRVAIATGDTRRFRWADIAFHAAVLECSGNVLLRPCVPLARWTCWKTPWDREAMSVALSEHEAILEAIQARDPGEAERAAQAHVRCAIAEVSKVPEAFAGAAVEEGGGGPAWR